MEKSNAEILHHFYSLLLEMNFSESPDEIPYAEEIIDPFIQKHLRQIKLKMAKNRAALKKNGYQLILQEIDRLRNLGADQLNKLLSPQQVSQLQPLFSKFESLSKKDEKSIAEDEELLQLIIVIKEKLDKQKPNE